jgi:hypothetical protein
VNSLIRKAVKAIGFKYLTAQVRAAAEGKLGPGWQKAYWGLIGWKRFTSFILGLVAGALALMGMTYYAELIGAIAAVGMSLGFVDAKWREDVTPDWVEQSVIWRFLADHAPVLAIAMFGAHMWLSGASCTLGEWCGYGTWAVTFIGFGFVHLGLLDTAWRTDPPKIEEIIPPKR